MPVKITFDKSRCVARVKDAWTKGLPLLTEEIKNDCNEYCKEREGTLKMSSDIHSRPKDGVIVWQTPYARRQYWEIRTAYTDKNPLATWRWAEVAKRNHKAKWERQAQRLMEMNL